MKKSSLYSKIVLFLVFCAAILFIYSCFTNSAHADTDAVIRYWNQDKNGVYRTGIVIDKETGVHYIVVSAQNYSNAVTVSVTPRLNADGTLFVSK